MNAREKILSAINSKEAIQDVLVNFVGEVGEFSSYAKVIESLMRPINEALSQKCLREIPYTINDMVNAIHSLYYPNPLADEKFITFDGTRYINLGIKPNDSLQFQIKVNTNDGLSTHVFGSRESAQSKACALLTLNSGSYRVNVGTKQVVFTTATSRKDPYVIDFDVNETIIKNPFSLEGVEVLSMRGGGGYGNSELDLYLGAINTMGSVSDVARFKGEIYYVKVYANNCILYDIVPNEDCTGFVDKFTGKQYEWINY